MKKRIIASVLVLLSAMFPFVDNLINYFGCDNFAIDFAQKFGHQNFYNFLYCIGAATTPILLTIASRLKAYFSSYIVLIFAYSTDFFWLFSSHKSSFDFSYMYGGLFTIGFVIASIFFSKNLQKEISRNKLIELLLNEKFKVNE
ncbi:hypothetical protein FLACOL_01103 [Flavobacterium columnare]|uniref:Uncharacterized protein n=2 Tax=Flavobacterium TaxID=237 RepID=A0A246GET0_9FLAO|nr:MULTISPECIES: hypothetical protein [Flavobacterium]OWP82644.1 hypothetical protein BWK59_14775 [Flavobacterium davisii]SPE77113.1 hypothetical protein FLACOL_01103 [Flavobacterium columnare]